MNAWPAVKGGGAVRGLSTEPALPRIRGIARRSVAHFAQGCAKLRPVRHAAIPPQASLDVQAFIQPSTLTIAKSRKGRGLLNSNDRSNSIPNNIGKA
jgi:hypothetical protein